MDLSGECGVTGALWRHYGVAGLWAEILPLGLVSAITGIGLWRLLPWARTAVIVLCWLELAEAVEQVIEALLARTCTSLTLSSAPVALVILLYFSRQKIKQLFHSVSAAETLAL
jgi:hypothetical protein